MRRSVCGLTASFICSTSFLVAPASAQTVAEAETPGSGDIVVTARRRDESIQQVPVAVTALSNKDLIARGTTNISDLAGVAPNLSIGSGARGAGIATVSLRGQENTGTGLANDPAVGIYFDEVYLGRSAGNLAISMQDMSSVQVLRGPQGTLFGRNNTGGAILLTPNRPDLETFGGSARLSYGSYDRLDLQGVLNVPIVADKLGIRASYMRVRRDGFGRNVFTGFDGYNNLKSDGGRVSMRWTPSDAVTMDLTYDQSQVRSVGAVTAPAGLTAASQDLAASLRFYELSSNLFGIGAVPRNDVDSRGYTFRTAVDITSETALKVIVGRRFVKTRLDSDSDASPANFNDIRQYMHASQWTAEVQLSGKTLQDVTPWFNSLTYTGGGFYFTETGLDGSVSRTPVVLGPTGRNFQLYITNSSAAAYLQLEAQAFDKLFLTVGGRYTRDKRSLSLRSLNDNACLLRVLPVGTDPSVCFQSGDAKFGYWSYSAGARYEFSRDLNFYLKYDKGQRAGGLASAPLTIETFKPETVRSLELGAKLDLFDNLLRLNVAAFTSKIDDLQRGTVLIDPVTRSPYSATFNVAKGTVRGVEVEAALRPMRGLELSGSLGYLDAYYNQYNDTRPTAPATVVNGEITIPAVVNGGDVSYLKFPNTPAWTYSLSGSYTADLSASTSLTVRADYMHKSFTYFEVSNIPRLSQKPYGLLNARIQLDLKDIFGSKQLYVAAFARNLTNTHYNVTGFNVAGGTYWRSDNPRTFGGEIGAEF